MLVDTFSFYIVILLLTLTEGFRRLDPPSRQWTERSARLRLRKPIDYPGSGRWGWLYQIPFLPTRSYFTHLWPLAVDPHSVAAASVDFAGQSRLEQQADFHLLFEKLPPPVIADQHLVLGRTRVRCHSAAQAQRLGLLLKTLQPLSPDERAVAIRRTLNQCCNAEAAAFARRQACTKTQNIRRLGIALHVVLLLVFPIAALVAGLAWAVIGCGVLAFVFSAAISHHFVVAHTALYRELPPPCWGDRLRLGLYPIGASFASDELLREAVSGFHPVALDAAQAGAEELRRAHYWLPVDPAAPGERTREWHYREWAAAIAAALETQKLNPAALLQVPQSSAASLSYCPRCAGEFQFAQGPCPDCPGRQVVAY